MTLSTESINGSDGRMLDRERLGVVYLRKAVSAVDKNADPEFRENVDQWTPAMGNEQSTAEQSDWG